MCAVGAWAPMMPNSQTHIGSVIDYRRGAVERTALASVYDFITFAMCRPRLNCTIHMNHIGYIFAHGKSSPLNVSEFYSFCTPLPAARHRVRAPFCWPSANRARPILSTFDLMRRPNTYHNQLFMFLSLTSSQFAYPLTINSFTAKKEGTEKI